MTLTAFEGHFQLTEPLHRQNVNQCNELGLSRKLTRTKLITAGRHIHTPSSYYFYCKTRP